jgi:hypothetical protein
MLSIDTVPAHTSAIRHNPSPNGPLAVDVRAPAGSIVLAPCPGQVKHTSCPDTASLPGCQIRGFLRLPNGREMPFVLAHLQRGTFPTTGQFFRKGAILGRMAFWEQHPASTHVHWGFRQPGDNFMPPPANIPIIRAFQLCGPPPVRPGMALAVSEINAEDATEIDAEDAEDYVPHGDIDVLDEEFEFDAEAFEQGGFDEEVSDEARVALNIKEQEKREGALE